MGFLLSLVRGPLNSRVTIFFDIGFGKTINSVVNANGDEGNRTNRRNANRDRDYSPLYNGTKEKDCLFLTRERQGVPRSTRNRSTVESRERCLLLRVFCGVLRPSETIHHHPFRLMPRRKLEGRGARTTYWTGCDAKKKWARSFST